MLICFSYSSIKISYLDSTSSLDKTFCLSNRAMFSLVLKYGKASGVVFKFNKPLDSASLTQESSYPLPLKIMRLWFLIVSLIKACNVVSKSSATSKIFANFSISSAMTVFNTILHPAILELDPGILNSNLFPVKANGEVRLRSVESLGNLGRTVAPIFINSFSFPSYGLSSSMAFNTAVNSSPKKIEIIAGGASLAPSR